MIETGSESICLVVGGGSGIGRAIAKTALELSWPSLIVDLDLSYWSNSSVPQMDVFELDILQDHSISNLAEYILGKGYRVDKLVFTIGRATTKPLQAMKPMEYNDLCNLNTISFLKLVGELSKTGLFGQDGASIVVISSLVGELGAKGKIAYAATKGALNAAIRSMALELALDGIRINAISPGTIQTEMLDRLINTIGYNEVQSIISGFPLGLGNPQDVADLAVFLLISQTSWLTGTVITLDGGFSAI